jgi:hypothetical protein
LVHAKDAAAVRIYQRWGFQPLPETITERMGHAPGGPMAGG